MALLHIDPQRCHTDGLCCAVCPMRIIVQKEEKSLPALIERGEDYCIGCGHCVAVCPHGALSHESMGPDDCLPVSNALSVTFDQAAQLMCSRRSIRLYRELPVDRATLSRLIEVARFAPSGHNHQPVEWLVLYDSALVRSLAGHVIDWMRHLVAEKSPMAQAWNLHRTIEQWEQGSDPICRKAPHLVMVHAPKEDLTAPAACNIALTYFELAAHAHGLGACWAGYFNAAAMYWPPMKNALALPDDNSPLGAMMVGHAQYRYPRIPARKKAEITWR